MGYGAIAKAPYAWPGAKANAKLKGPVEAPPLPKDLIPVQLLQACPAGEMRQTAKAVAPGQSAPEQPCVPIAKAVPAATVKDLSAETKKAATRGSPL